MTASRRSIALVAVVLLAGCKSGEERVSPFEAQEFKRRLITEHANELTEGQKRILMGHPARNRAELDEIQRAFEAFRADYRRRQAFDEAQLRDADDPSGAGSRTEPDDREGDEADDRDDS